MVSPYLNHFIQPDTIVPAPYSPQSWNRYSYVKNSPIIYSDPSGHDGITPAGNVITVNFALGLNIGPTFLVYYSLSLVTDNEGGFQFYGTKRDQTYHEGSSGKMGGFESGDAEKKHPTQLLAVGGLSITYGAFEGKSVRERGTNGFSGRAVVGELGVGPISGDYYQGFDERKGRIDGSSLRGWDIGVSIGGPLTIGSIATNSTPLFGDSRHQLPSWMIPGCKAIALCGSLPPALYYGAYSLNKIKNWTSKKIKIPSPIKIN